jgi:SHS2 domain-containing protein
MFETFEHTADIGLRIRAPDINALFAEAGQGLFSLIVENPDSIRSQQRIEITLNSATIEDLLFDWLNELLYTFETRHLLLCRFDVRVEDHSLRATASGEELDRARHHISREIKAITYHAFVVRQTPDGWLAEVILDI